jgi:hypothetical protein
MTVRDLNGNIVNWNLTGHIAKGRIKEKSSFHLAARKILTQIFPTLQILEEVPIPLRKSETLYLDFYLPLIKRAIEVHGEQHYKFTPFYHSNRINFLKAQKKDNEKREWCEINGINHIVLPHFENIDKWKALIIYDNQNS